MNTASSLLTLSPLLAALLAACAVGPDYERPTPQTQASFANVAGSDEFQQAQPVVAFWTVFDDAQLSAIVEQALRSNHDLRIALANLNQARALRREAKFDYLPTITADAGYTHRLLPEAQLPGFGRDVRENEIYSGGFDATWELDFFGRVRRANQASKATEQALEATLADAQVSVAAEVARTYFELRGAQERHAVAARNADNQLQTVQLAKAQLDAGSGTEFDVARAQAQLSTTLSALPQFDANVQNAIHRLSVLTGQQPNALQASLQAVKALPELPRLTAIGSPEDLLRRRADIRAAERRLAASTAQVGVATADLFPRVSFRGEIGFAASSVDDIGHAAGETWSYGPGITWAAFDLGRVKARIDQTKAMQDGSLARYEQTVLRALEETENALVSYSRSRQQLEYLRDSVAAGDRAVELAHVRYDGGASGFLDVLTAERAQLQAQDELAAARTATGTTLIALYKALGGGWAASDSAVAQQATSAQMVSGGSVASVSAPRMLAAQRIAAMSLPHSAAP
jgi:multidrug efflux system outer membrane protein